MEEKLPVWQKPFYWLGWLQALNIVFWISLAIMYYIKEDKTYFNINTKHRISYWGMFSVVGVIYLIFATV